MLLNSVDPDQLAFTPPLEQLVRGLLILHQLLNLLG